MPSYALLGATGNIGQAILTVLLQSSDNTIHAYCRSEQKLLKLSPEIKHNPNVKIFEGSLDDQTLLADCLRGTRAVFHVVAPPGNQPGTTTASDTARKITTALEQLKSDNETNKPTTPHQPLPKVIVISSASTDHSLMPSAPHFLLNILYRAFSHTYDDLKRAESHLRAQDPWLTSSFIKPGALSHDTQKGHALSLTEAKSPVSFLDLAAGMVEVADDADGRFAGRSVAVNATAWDVAFPWTAPGDIVRGLISHFFPWSYRYIG